MSFAPRDRHVALVNGSMKRSFMEEDCHRAASRLHTSLVTDAGFIVTNPDARGAAGWLA
jgi:hypothetical protein